jgi:hypothetical protein
VLLGGCSQPRNSKYRYHNNNSNKHRRLGACLCMLYRWRSIRWHGVRITVQQLWAQLRQSICASLLTAIVCLHQCYHLLFEFRSNMADENGPLQYRKLPTDFKRQNIIHYTLDLSLTTFSPPFLVLSSCGGVLHCGVEVR